MAPDQTLKDLLQLSADVQDGFWEASCRAHSAGLAGLFQSAAMQWNSFADRIFPILLQINHTSPEARWRADPNRIWMNPKAHLGGMDDLAVCEQCVQGLELARDRLDVASGVSLPQVREALQAQLCSIKDQIADIVRAVEDADRPAV
jgi:uncharacterized protein (TIGR02284 family)